MIPFGKAKVVREGTDLTVITYGATVQRSVVAAKALEEERGASVEIIDLRTLSPVDWETVYGSIRKTNRAMVVYEDSMSWGYGAEIAARVTERCFRFLHAPILRVTGFDIPYPPPMLESMHLPNVDRILDTIARLQWDDVPDQRWLEAGSRA